MNTCVETNCVVGGDLYEPIIGLEFPHIFPSNFSNSTFLSSLPIQISEKMTREFGIPVQTAREASDAYLRRFRRNVENPRMSIDDWRILLWVNALGEEYEEFAGNLLIFFPNFPLRPHLKSGHFTFVFFQRRFTGNGNGCATAIWPSASRRWVFYGNFERNTNLPW